MNMLLEQGSLFAERYQLKKLLGRGGFSEVWLASDKMSGVDVAIKVYAPYGGLDENGLALFSKEFSLVFNINQTNLLKPTYFDSYNGSPYLILPFCSRGATTSLIGKCDDALVTDIIHDVAAGLSYLHSQEPPIIHQDIKPDNILINEHGDYLITDFGISTKIRSTLRKSVASQDQENSGGTYSYMGPERFSKHPAPVKASDIWSLGAMAFELVEGMPPFDNMGGVMQKNGAEIPEIQSNISDTLKQIIYLCMSLNPWDRPSAEDLVSWTSSIRAGQKPKLPSDGSKRSLLGKLSGTIIKGKDQNADFKGTVVKESKKYPSNGSGKPKQESSDKKPFPIKWLVVAVLVALAVVAVIFGINKHNDNMKEKELKRKEEIRREYIESEKEKLSGTVFDDLSPNGVIIPIKYEGKVVESVRCVSMGELINAALEKLGNPGTFDEGWKILEGLSVREDMVSSSVANAWLAFFYSVKPYSERSAANIKEYHELAEKKEYYYVNSKVDSIPDRAKIAHRYSRKAVQLDSNCYKALFELAMDYADGKDEEDPTALRGAVDRRVDSAFIFYNRGYEKAKEANDTVYMKFFESGRISKRMNDYRKELEKSNKKR